MVAKGTLPPEPADMASLCKGTTHGAATAKDLRHFRGEVRYMAASNHNYKILQVVEHRFNRAIIFDSRQLHADYLDRAAVAALSCEPPKRRLIASFFL